VLFVALLSGCAADAVDLCAEQPLVIGHRGSGTSSASEPLPENTTESALAALADGADGVEIDVQLTVDGVVVLMHDATVDRTTDGTGCIAELTAAEVAALDAGGPNMGGAGIGVPTLAGFLDAYDGDLDIELKIDAGNGACPATDSMALAAAVNAALLDDPRVASRIVWFSSFSLDALLDYRSVDPMADLALIAVVSNVAAAAEDELFGLNLISNSIGAGTLTAANEAGLELWAWTVNDPARLAELFEGPLVDAVITDDVGAAVMAREAAYDACVSR
jgi:glycerophosphoryl diester phosphodiesterase